MILKKISNTLHRASPFAIALPAVLFVSLLVSCGGKNDQEQLTGLIRQALPPSTISVFHRWHSDDCWETQVWMLGNDWPKEPGKAISLPGCVGAHAFSELFKSGQLSKSGYDTGRIQVELYRSYASLSVYSQDLTAWSLEHDYPFSWNSSNTLQPGNLRFDCSYRFDSITVADLEISPSPALNKMSWDSVIDCSAESDRYSMSQVRLFSFYSEQRGFEGLFTDSHPRIGQMFSQPDDAGASPPKHFSALVLLKRIDRSMN